MSKKFLSVSPPFPYGYMNSTNPPRLSKSGCEIIDLDKFLDKMKDVVYTVGEKFPDESLYGHNGFTCRLTRKGIEVCVCIPNITQAQEQTWLLKPLQYGLYTNGGIPFLVARCDGTKCFGGPFSFYGVSEIERKQALDIGLHSLYLFIIDTQVNVLKAIRIVEINDRVVSELKSAIISQKDEFKSNKEVFDAICVIYDSVDSFEEMYNLTKVHYTAEEK